MKIRILGCGTSSGVPRIGNDWGRCDPNQLRNRRTRASIIVESDTTRILIDTSPDMREQLLAANISDIDAVIWTHDHADHCHGIDDLRQLFHARGHAVAGYAREETLTSLRQRFGYAFEGKEGYPPMVSGRVLEDVLKIGDIEITVIDQPHGSITSAGFRFDYRGLSAGYSTDFHEMTGTMRAVFAGLDVWVVDALRRKPHPTHASLNDTLGWIEELGVRRAILTHMDHSMDYETLRSELPDGVVPGYDGQEVEFLST